MSLVRALKKTNPRMIFTRPPSTGQATLYSTSVANVQQDSFSKVRPYEDIPGPKGLYQWPIIGPMLHFKPFTDKTPLQVSSVFTELMRKYGPIVKVKFGRTFILISDPKDTEVLFRNEGKYPARFPFDIAKVYAERNNFRYTLADLDGEQWHVLRSALNKRLLQPNSAINYLEQQNIVADEFIDILASQNMQPDEVTDLFTRYSVESNGLVCFNARLGLLDPVLRHTPDRVAFRQAIKDNLLFLYKSLSGGSVAHTWYRNKTYRGFEKANLLIKAETIKHITNAKKIVEARRKAGTLDPNESNLLLSLLSENELHHDDIVNLLEILFGAGIEGVSVHVHFPKSCKDYFDRPDIFLPERWLRSSEGRLNEEIPKLASLSFGFGPRNCAGRRLAEQEMYLAVAKALQKLRIDIEPESANTTFVHSIYVQSSKPIKFRFTKLDH